MWMPGSYKIRACKPLTVGLFSGLKLLHTRYDEKLRLAPEGRDLITCYSLHSLSMEVHTNCARIRPTQRQKERACL